MPRDATRKLESSTTQVEEGSGTVDDSVDLLAQPFVTGGKLHGPQILPTESVSGRGGWTEVGVDSLVDHLADRLPSQGCAGLQAP
jgi:hypothetical protein